MRFGITTYRGDAQADDFNEGNTRIVVFEFVLDLSWANTDKNKKTIQNMFLQCFFPLYSNFLPSIFNSRRLFFSCFFLFLFFLCFCSCV